MTRRPDELTAEEANEQIMLQAGRKAPYTMVGDWVALAVSAGLIEHIALSLYVVLAAHVNVERGDRDVWPSRGTLASMLGLKQARSVDKYLGQLEALGAIEAIRGGTGKGSSGYRRNRYTVHQAPPAGYAGVITLADWYKARKAEREQTARESAAQDVVRSSTLPQERSAPQRTTRSARQRTTPSAAQRTTVVRHSAHEQEENQLDEEKGGTPASTTAPAAQHAPAPPPSIAKDINNPDTWRCPKHLELYAADPAADPGACPGCGRVRRQAERWWADQEKRGADCPMCVSDGRRPDGLGSRWTRVAPGTQTMLVPYRSCDHTTPHEDVLAQIQADEEAAEAARQTRGPVDERQPLTDARRAELRALASCKPPRPRPRAGRVPRRPAAPPAAEASTNDGQEAAGLASGQVDAAGPAFKEAGSVAS